MHIIDMIINARRLDELTEVKKIVFVGVHFKEGFKALDSRTRTGKIIDRIISCLPYNVSVEKMNLFSTTYLPDKIGQAYAAMLFPVVDSITYVALGGIVQEHLEGDNIIPVTHPGYIMRFGNEDEYVHETTKKIINHLEAQAS